MKFFPVSTHYINGIYYYMLMGNLKRVIPRILHEVFEGKVYFNILYFQPCNNEKLMKTRINFLGKQ